MDGLNKAFISLAGVDRPKAERLLSSASKFLYEIYYHDFVDGATLVEQMKRVVRECSLFILFASKASLASVWCRYEISLAEVEVIKRGIKIFVAPLEPGLTLEMVPEWMKRYWISTEFPTERSLSRHIANILQRELFLRYCTVPLSESRMRTDSASARCRGRRWLLIFTFFPEHQLSVEGQPREASYSDYLGTTYIGQVRKSCSTTPPP